MTTSIDRVREVITASGMSQAEFASAVGLDAPKLSKSLSGVRRFTSSDVAHIADVGKVSVDWLLGGDEPALATAARRAAGSSSEHAVAEAQRYGELRSVATDLGFPLDSLPTFELGDGRPRDEGAALAGQALDQLEGDAVTTTDLSTLLEDAFGVDVIITDLGQGFDGLAAVTTDARLILANVTPLAARQRFTIAHELAHILAQDNQGVHLDKDVFAGGSDPTEVRANAFAAALLMPEAVLTSRVKAGFGEAAFANIVVDLVVSPMALAIRLVELNLIDKVMAASFKRMSFADAAKASGRSGDVAALTTQSAARRPPQRLARDLFQAYTDGETTLRPYAAAVGADPREVRAALEAQKGDV